MDARRVAFVDASGDPSLDTQKTGVSPLFVVTAVLVPPDREQALRSDVDHVRESHFGTGEMKSSGIGGDPARRARVLEKLSSLQFRFYTLVIDKAALNKGSGLVYKRSFLKYVHHRLFETICGAFPDATIVADEHGRPEFMRGFEDYVYRTVAPDLFVRPRFAFRGSRGEPLLQLADMISGTLARHYTHEDGDSGDLWDLLRPHALGVEEWPLRRRSGFGRAAGDESIDGIIERYCVVRAQEFVEKNEDSEDVDVRSQVLVLRRLLYECQVGEPTEYVPTWRLRHRLGQVHQDRVSEHYIRSRVIAKLRDQDVIVASSSKGYKIPTREQDLHEFVEHTMTRADPMLLRLERAWRQIKTVTDGAVDLLDVPAAQHLRPLFEPGVRRGADPDSGSS